MFMTTLFYRGNLMTEMATARKIQDIFLQGQVGNGQSHCHPWSQGKASHSALISRRCTTILYRAISTTCTWNRGRRAATNTLSLKSRHKLHAHPSLKSLLYGIVYFSLLVLIVLQYSPCRNVIPTWPKSSSSCTAWSRFSSNMSKSLRKKVYGTTL